MKYKKQGVVWRSSCWELTEQPQIQYPLLSAEFREHTKRNRYNQIFNFYVIKKKIYCNKLILLIVLSTPTKSKFHWNLKGLNSYWPSHCPNSDIQNSKSSRFNEKLIFKTQWIKWNNFALRHLAFLLLAKSLALSCLLAELTQHYPFKYQLTCLVPLRVTRLRVFFSQ